MDRAILTQSLFQTTSVATSWRSHVASSVVHGALIIAALVITFPMIRNEVQHRRFENATLIAPQLPVHDRAPAHIQTPRVVTRHEAKFTPQQPMPKPVEIKRPEVKPLIAAAPELKSVAVPVQPLPELKRAVPAPKPEIRTGAFQSAEAARAPQVPKAVQVGGFGDPRGVTPSENARPSAMSMAKVGSFDLPEGAGQAGGGKQSASGGVRQANFGSMGESPASGGTSHGSASIRTGGFGDSSAVPAQAGSSAGSKPVEPVFTPVAILSKPKPAYTEEARNLKLEGQVSLQVVFQSNGSIRILRVVHGLGHGLDEAAEQAALQVHFRPATRGGVPVDSDATIHITFQLT